VLLLPVWALWATGVSQFGVAGTKNVSISVHLDNPLRYAWREILGVTKNRAWGLVPDLGTVFCDLCKPGIDTLHVGECRIPSSREGDAGLPWTDVAERTGQLVCRVPRDDVVSH